MEEKNRDCRRQWRSLARISKADATEQVKVDLNEIWPHDKGRRATVLFSFFFRLSFRFFFFFSLFFFHALLSLRSL